MNIPRDRFDPIDQEQLAAQVVAIMDAHWARPSAEQKKDILGKAERQIEAGELIRQDQRASEELRLAP
jgi:hypothetical protein